MRERILVGLAAVLASFLFGCAFSAAGYGINAASAWGKGSVNCTFAEDGKLIGGQGCVAGAALSDQAASAIESVFSKKKPGDICDPVAIQKAVDNGEVSQAAADLLRQDCAEKANVTPAVPDGAPAADQTPAKDMVTALERVL